MQFKFGLDPEFIISQDNELKSAISILPSKENPIKKKEHKFYYDNVLAEIAVKPGNDKDEVINNIQEALKLFAEIISPAKFEIKAATEYPEEELRCDQAKIAGCNPEWSVYNLQVIEPPKKLIGFKNGYYYFKIPFRTAGGHIHLQSKLLEEPLNLFNVIRMMDLFIGIPSIFLDTDSSSASRRKAYGLAGSHRIPEDETGRLEYRPLSNFWLSSPDYVKLIYDLCEFVLYFVSSKECNKLWASDEIDELGICIGYDLSALQKSINNCDKNQAEKFMMIVENYLPVDLFKRIQNLSNKELPNPYIAWGIQ